MKIEKSKLGAYLCQLEPIEDSRGLFTEMFSPSYFNKIMIDSSGTEHFVDNHIYQVSRAYSNLKNTLRGLHYQDFPLEETKFIRCTGGSIYDVIVDIRPKSNTFGQWESFTLEDRDIMLVVPRGFAHGYLTLKDITEVEYFTSAPYSPSHARGIWVFDKEININWPLKSSANAIMSDRDKSLPRLRDVFSE